MRLRLTLKPVSNSKILIPINYQYPVSSAIYKILNRAEPDFARLFHENGYPTEHRRRFKFFTFSKFFFSTPAKVKDNTLILNENTSVKLFISSFNEEDFIKNFIIGLFEAQEFPIGLKNVCHTIFKVTFVELIPEPALIGTLKCKALAPICLSIPNSKMKADYLKALDERVENSVRNNLIWKFKTLFGENTPHDEIKFQIDKDYVNKCGGEAKVSKLITIKENQPEETKIRGFIAPFTISAPQKLLEIAYRCGIGEKNSMGFGMFEVENSLNHTDTSLVR